MHAPAMCVAPSHTPNCMVFVSTGGDFTDKTLFLHDLASHLNDESARKAKHQATEPRTVVLTNVFWFLSTGDENDLSSSLSHNI